MLSSEARGCRPLTIASSYPTSARLYRRSFDGILLFLLVRTDSHSLETAVSPKYAGIPHRSTEDDSYRGYFIPKGSVVIVNMWHLLRNPEIYSEPDRFKPERYLSENGKEPEQDPLKGIAFGFGRR